MLKLWLVRHGETLANQHQRVQGHSESPLTARGKYQAGKLGARLKGHSFDAVFASDLSRAVDTAGIIAPRNAIITLENLREQAFGPWEGKSFREIQAENPALWDAMIHDFTAEPQVLPGMETFDELVVRAGVAMEEIRTRCPEGVAIAVSHGGTLFAVYCHLIGAIPPHRSVMSNTALGLVVHDGTRWRIRNWNDTLHLNEPTGESVMRSGTDGIEGV